VMLKIAVPDVVYVRVTRRNLHRIRHKPPKDRAYFTCFRTDSQPGCQTVCQTKQWHMSS
jgi:hypothetical protein